MISVLWMVYEIRGWYPSAVALFGEALDAFDEDSEDEATVVARALSSAVRSWFLSLLSRQKEGAEAAAKAADTLRASADPEALWLALVCLALGVAYLGEDWTAVADEGVALGETLDGPFWVASFENWRGGAALMAGDFETGKRVLLEGMEVYRQLDERYWLSANFQHQAQIAIPEGRIEDAIDLFGRLVVKAREVGTVRVLQMSLTGLGDANMAAGNSADAETAFIEGLATSEQMGLVREMLDLLRKVANAPRKRRAEAGSRRDACNDHGRAIELSAVLMDDRDDRRTGIRRSGRVAGGHGSGRLLRGARGRNLEAL